RRSALAARSRLPAATPSTPSPHPHPWFADMTLYLIQTNTAVAWTGQRLADGNLYPLNVEAEWTPDALAGVGLYAAAPADPVPVGQIVTGSSVQIVNGVPKWVNET